MAGADGIGKKGHQGYQAKKRECLLDSFLSPFSCRLAFFSLLLALFFVFYDTSIGRQITSGKEEESNTTSFIQQKLFLLSRLFHCSI
jgi:hypothetical protein